MSPESGCLLLNEVAPRIASAARHCVRFVGAEDHQEVTQDAIAMAAKIVHNAEINHKKVTAGNVAYYALQHAKSGRRSVGHSSADVLGTATQLNGRSRVWSLEHPIPVADETHEEFAFAEMFESDQDDPSTLTARKLDWQSFMATQGDRAKAVIECMAEGRSLKSAADKLRLSPATMLYHKERLAKSIKEFMGEDVLAQAVKLPAWKTNLVAMREKHTCGAQDRHLQAASI
jgi:DNA-binding NarL/FixJ family response regulator